MLLLLWLQVKALFSSVMYVHLFRCFHAFPLAPNNFCASLSRDGDCKFRHFIIPCTSWHGWLPPRSYRPKQLRESSKAQVTRRKGWVGDPTQQQLQFTLPVLMQRLCPAALDCSGILNWASHNHSIISSLSLVRNGRLSLLQWNVYLDKCTSDFHLEYGVI